MIDATTKRCESLKDARLAGIVGANQNVQRRQIERDVAQRLKVLNMESADHGRIKNAAEVVRGILAY
ncbi:MAG: hypothetical protein M3552_01900 [Planctomycetota bacterium]|nr:hypothetical protein [Planctomycetota bacterium]